MRRDEWIKAGVFEAIHKEAVHAYGKVIGLDLSEVAVGGRQHKSPWTAPTSGWSMRRGTP